MDLEEVKVCLRAVLSSNPSSYHLKSLLNDFKNTTGFNLPLFGHPDPLRFLRSLEDTVQLQGDSCNPEVALVKSDKSAHIISLVDRQRVNDKIKTKNPYIKVKQRRQLVPLKSSGNSDSSKTTSLSSDSPAFNQAKDGEMEISMSTPTNIQNLSPKIVKQLEPETVLQLSETHLSNSELPKSPIVLKNQTIDTKSQERFCSTNITSKPPPNEKVPCESNERQKTNSYYFEDVSDNDSCRSTEMRSSWSPALPLSCGSINSGIKMKLKKLIKNYPEGLWCCELPELFFQEFHFVLDYREFGYTSLIQMLSELPDIFRCIRPGNEDWILFDASVVPSAVEKKILNFQTRGDVICNIKANIQKLLSKSCENSSLGIELDKVGELYEEMFGTTLDFQSLGFKDVKSLLEMWEASFLYIININGKLFCGPAFSRTAHSPVQWEEALPPITAENDIFLEIFPKEVVGPDERLLELDLTRHIAVGHVVEVCIAEVWSPSKFFVQLNKFKNRLNRFMDDLQKFYTVHLSKYKMPESTIRPSQICVGLYNADPEFPDEWHRAEILKVINEKTVLINFVDYGTVTRVKKSQLRFLHRSFKSFPIQAFQAQLSGVAPPNDEAIWPMTTSKKFLELLRVPYLNAEMVDIDFKKPSLSVILFDPFQKSKPNVNKKLVQEKLARVAEPLYYQEAMPEATLTEAETRELHKKSSDALVQANESFSKNVPEITDQFLDIDDLSQSTLFHFKMKSLTPESSREKVEASKVEPTNVTYVFDEIPELRKSDENETGEIESEIEAKQKIPQDDVLGVTEVLSESTPPTSTNKEEKLRCLTPPSIPEEELTPETSRANTAVTEQTPPRKPKRLPPGLEHVNTLSDFGNIPLLLQPQDLRKKINLLAMELLIKNESIKQVGVNDPVLAMKIATELAEAYVSSQISVNFPTCYNFYPMYPTPFVPSAALPADVPEDKSEKGSKVVEAELPRNSQAAEIRRQDIGFKCGDISVEQNSSHASTPEVKVNRSPTTYLEEYVEKTQIGGNILHLVRVDNELYLCAEEVVRHFTIFSNREIADRVLHTKKIRTDYRVISKKSDEKVLRALKSSDLPGVVKGKSKKLKIYLLQVAKVVPYLQALGCRTKPFEDDFLELQKVWEERKCQQTKLS